MRRSSTSPILQVPLYPLLCQDGIELVIRVSDDGSIRVNNANVTTPNVSTQADAFDLPLAMCAGPQSTRVVRLTPDVGAPRFVPQVMAGKGVIHIIDQVRLPSPLDRRTRSSSTAPLISLFCLRCCPWTITTPHHPRATPTTPPSTQHHPTSPLSSCRCPRRTRRRRRRRRRSYCSTAPLILSHFLTSGAVPGR